MQLEPSKSHSPDIDQATILAPDPTLDWQRAHSSSVRVPTSGSKTISSDHRDHSPREFRPTFLDALFDDDEPAARPSCGQLPNSSNKVGQIQTSLDDAATHIPVGVCQARSPMSENWYPAIPRRQRLCPAHGKPTVPCRPSGPVVIVTSH